MENMMIKDAAKKLGVEAHVLRYWEDELGLEIKRNSMGHRYYDERDLQLFDMVKELKENGLTLKDIKQAIDKQKKLLASEMAHRHNEENLQLNPGAQADEEIEGKEGHVKEKVDSFVTEAKTEKVNRHYGSEIKSDESANNTQEQGNENDMIDVKIVDFKQAQLQSVMNRVVANALRENKDIITSSIKGEITADVMRQFDTVMREKEEREEARFKKIDEYLRQLQQVNSEVAATKSRRLFGRRK